MTSLRIYIVRHSGLGHGWYVTSHAADDRYDIRTEAGPFTSREAAETVAAASNRVTS